MTRADCVHSTPPTNAPIDTTRRRFLAVSGVAAAIGAGSLAAAAMATNDVPKATPVRPTQASGCSLLMRPTTRINGLIAAWDRDNPMPASRRGRRRNIKRAHAYYVAIKGFDVWQAVVAAENDFHDAQEIVADVECFSKEDLNLLVEASLMHDDRDISRGNRAPIARAVVRAIAGGRLS